MEAPSLDLYGFHTLYSIFSLVPLSTTEILFSLYTLSPGKRFLVTKTSYLPLAINTPGCLCGTTAT